VGVLTRGLRVLDTALEKLVRELMTGNVDDALLRLVVRDLRSGKLLSQGFRRSIGDAEALLKRLSVLAKQLQFRRKNFAWMFGDGLALARRDPIRSEYLRLCDRLREFARTPDFEKLIDPKLAPAARAAMEAYARELMQNVAGIVDRYGDLYRETYLVNALTRRLYRGPTPSVYKRVTAPTTDIYLGLRIDAQHIIEQRAFAKFKKDWALLGWASESDMPAIPVMHEWHIPSPKNLMGLEDTKLQTGEPIADIFSLTKEMERDLPLDKFKTADDYLKALKKFYGYKVTSKQGREIEPLRPFTQFVEQVEKALVVARDKAAKAAKAASK
jgi:hypothetical protein